MRAIPLAQSKSTGKSFGCFFPLRALSLRLFLWRHGGEETKESLEQSWVSDDGVAEGSVGESGDHGYLHSAHDLASANAEDGDTEDAICFGVDECLHEAACLGERDGAEVGGHWDLRQAIRDSVCLGFGFVEANSCQLGVGEDAEWDLTTCGDAIAAGEVVADDAKVIERDVGKFWGAGALADGPDAGRACLEPLVNFDVPVFGEFYARDFEAEARGVGRATSRDENIRAFDCLL